MNSKKAISLVAALMLAITVFSVSVFAAPADYSGRHHDNGRGHGHNCTGSYCTEDCPYYNDSASSSRNNSTRKPRYEICSEEGCTETGVHQHDGVNYCSSTPSRQGNGRQDGTGNSTGGRGRGCGSGRCYRQI